TVFAAGDAADANPSDNQAERLLGIRNIAPRAKAPAEPVVAEPGAETRFTIEVENAGATSVLLVPDLALPAGWNGRLEAAALGPLATPGEPKASLGIVVRPPPGAEAGRYLLTLRVSGQGAPDAAVELLVPVTVAARHDVQVDPAPAEVAPGEPSLVPVTLVNAGNARETLAFSTVPAGLVSPGTPSVVLAPFETRVVQVPVVAPAAASPGPFAFKLVARSSATESAADAVVEIRRAYAPRLSLEGAAEILPGKANVVKLVLENVGNAPGTTSLRAAVAAGAVASGVTVTPDLVMVAPGERREITVSLMAPVGMSAPLLVEALSYEGAPRLDPEATAVVTRTALSVPVAARIPDLRIVSLEMNPKFNLFAGDLVTYTVVVENAGRGDAAAALAGLFMDATLVQEVAMPAIPAGGRATLTLAAPAVAGEHFATVLLDLGAVLPEGVREDNALALKVTATGVPVSGGTFGAATGKDVPAASGAWGLVAAAAAASVAGVLSRRRRAP
ncbi:MAG TPA: CARDB domain-containing protein, partial [Candidatus Thermoplasmatota archaeon]|nr:CARDB domain-containing protein [Candidatus Thermoplasmatota archaeon]